MTWWIGLKGGKLARPRGFMNHVIDLECRSNMTQPSTGARTFENRKQEAACANHFLSTQTPNRQNHAV